jgi:hypothetical protein
MPIMVDRKAPYSGLSSIMAMKGRMGDTELVHMSKPEVRALENLGQMTRNPATGLPEAFTLRDAIPAAAGIAASVLAPGVGTALFGMSPIWSTALAGGVGTGIGSLATGKGAEQSLFNAAIGFGLGGILGNLTAGADPTQGGKLLEQRTTTLPVEEAAILNRPQTITEVMPTATLTRPAASEFGQMLGGATQPMTVQAGQALSPAEVAQLTGGRMGAGPVFGTGESIGAALRSPMTYAPLAGAALTYQKEEDMPPMDSMGVPQQRSFTISGGEPLSPPVTQQSALDIALGRAPARRFVSPYTTTRTMAEGGMVEDDEEDGDITEAQKTSLRQLKDALDESLRRYGVTPAEMSKEDRLRLRQLRQMPTTPATLQQQEDAIKKLEEALSGISAMAEGGRMDNGGEKKYFEGRVNGNGDGMSDEVEFEVEGENPDLALLSRDEYVLPADVVAMIGNGSSNAGADKLDAFVKQVRKESFGTEKQQRELKGGGLSGLKIMKYEVGGGIGSEADAAAAQAANEASVASAMGEENAQATMQQEQEMEAARNPSFMDRASFGLQSFLDKSLVDPTTSRGSTLAGFVGGFPLGGIARVVENINNQYYGGTARAFSPAEEAAMAARGGDGSQMQELLRKTA